VPQNVEIKIRLDDLAATLAAAVELAGAPAEEIRQHDTFYAAARGRLKLRRFADGSGELIAYDRPDRPGPKTSRYRLFRTDDAAGLAAVLAAALEPLGDVIKVRQLVLVGRTRIHLDRVEGLGDFLELEVVLDVGEDPAAGETEAAHLLGALGLTAAERVSGAYLDLLQPNSGF
jgi:predicted adenylyl cyclase CyaB